MYVVQDMYSDQCCLGLHYAIRNRTRFFTLSLGSFVFTADYNAQKCMHVVCFRMEVESLGTVLQNGTD
jgi:hypothetical protein